MPVAVDQWTNPIGGVIDLTTDGLVDENIWDKVIGNEEYLYRRRVAEFLNNSGGAILARDVVVLDTTANDAFTTTTTVGDGRALGVAAEDIAAGVTGKIIVGGLADVLVNASTNRGDFISTSATAKMGQPSAAAGTSDFARATQSRIGSGLVRCYLFGMGRIPPGIRLQGSQNGEFSTNSTTNVTVSTVSGLAIPATASLILVVAAWRRSATAEVVNGGISLNGGAIVNQTVAMSDANGVARQGILLALIGPRQVNYDATGIIFAASPGVPGVMGWLQDLTIGTITSIGVGGRVAAAASLVYSNLRVYAFD